MIRERQLRLLLHIMYPLQKLKNRVSVLQRSRMSDKDKAKWMGVLHPGFISSDHSASGTDSEDDTLVTQLLEWRSKKVTEFFYQLDVYAEDGKSAQAKKQTKDRVLADCPSLRSPPQGKFPSWALGN